MKRLIFLTLLLAMATAARAQAPQPGWVTDAKSGCRMWNPEPEPEETIQWEGPCVGGVGNGRGVLRWFSKGEGYETDTGEFRNGRLHGHATLSFTNGARFEGEFVEQKPHGQGTWRNQDGEVFSGKWTMGCFKQGEQQTVFNATEQECGFAK